MKNNLETGTTTRRLRNVIAHKLVPVYIVIGLALLGILAMVVLYFTLKDNIYFYLMMSFSIALALFVLIRSFIYPKQLSDVVSKGLTSDMMRAINTMSVQKDPIYLSRSGISEFDDLKMRFADVINSMRDVVIVNRDVDESYLKFGYEYGFNNLITKDSFIYNLPFVLKLNTATRGGLILVKIADCPEPPKEALDELINCIHYAFSTKIYVGRYSSDTLIAYISDIESLSVFKSLCYKVYSSFSFLETGFSASKVLTCLVGAAVYPYSLKNTLLSDALQALSSSKDVLVYLPSSIGYGVSGQVSQDDIRRKDLLIIDQLIGYLFNFSTTSADQAQMKNLLTELATYSGFTKAGLVSRPTGSGESGNFSCLTEVGANSIKVFEGRADISFEELKPFYEAKNENNCFYSTRREDLPADLAKFYDKYGLSAVFVSFFGEGGEILGISYFFSGDKVQPISSIDSHVIVLELMVMDYLAIRMISAYRASLSDNDLETVLKLEDRMRYVISSSSYDLLAASEGLKEYLPKGSFGQKCYKVLFGLDKPCENCPFTSQKDANAPVAFKDRKFVRKKLSYDTPDSTGSILMEPFIPSEKEKRTLRFDPATFLSSRSSFNQAIDNLVLGKSKGALLLITLEGINKIVETYGESNLDSILIEIKKRIVDLEITDRVFRYDDAVLAVYFAEATRVQLYDIIEEIHESLMKDYSVEGHLVKCHFRYVEINFLGTFNTSLEVYSTIDKGLVQAKKLPDDYMCIANENISRTASKNDYVLYLMENNYLNKAVEFRTQPITSAKDGSIRYGEILLRLYDSLREKMLSPLEVVTIASDNKKMGKFDSLNYENAIGLYNKYGNGIFRLYSYGGFTINLSSDSLESNDWLVRLRKFIEANPFPEKFLALEIAEHDFKNELGRIKVWLNELRSYHLSWAVDNYADEQISPREIAELGFDTVKLSRHFLLDAVADPVAKGLFESVIRECHYNNLLVTIQGVENQDQYDFAKKAGADSVQGFFLYEPLKIDDFLQVIQEHPDKAKIAETQKAENQQAKHEEIKKKLSLRERIKRRQTQKQLAKYEKEAGQVQVVKPADKTEDK